MAHTRRHRATDSQQLALHHKRGYKWLRRKQEEDNSAGLTLMRRASITTAGNIVTAMQMVQQERDQVREGRP